MTRAEHVGPLWILGDRVRSFLWTLRHLDAVEPESSRSGEDLSAWKDAKVAVYCDGFAFHGDREMLELDAHKRNWLQTEGWTVLTYWGRTILQDPDGCARQIAAAHRARSRRSAHRK